MNFEKHKRKVMVHLKNDSKAQTISDVSSTKLITLEFFLQKPLRWNCFFTKIAAQARSSGSGACGPCCWLPTRKVATACTALAKGWPQLEALPPAQRHVGSRGESIPPPEARLSMRMGADKKVRASVLPA